MWVTTERNGTKYLWERKPERTTKGGGEWINGGQVVCLAYYPFDELPSFIQQQQWKDAPIQVKLTLSKK